MGVHLLIGDCRQRLSGLAPDSVDSVVTDPPYGLGAPPDPAAVLRSWLETGDFAASGAGFRGHAWDAFVPSPAIWREVFRVLRPGGHLVAFFGTRTYDFGVIALRLAGFEIRDQVAWIHGQGFPKSKSSLKPALEPIVVARKPPAAPLPGVDACRIGARWPANVAHDGSPEVLALMPEGRGAAAPVRGDEPSAPTNGVTLGTGLGRVASEVIDAPGSAARFFYCAKATPGERRWVEHPTIKPVAFMRWLVRLVTPPGGIILDPFAGTGTTGEAARLEGFGAVLVEREQNYAAAIIERLGMKRNYPGPSIRRLK